MDIFLILCKKLTLFSCCFSEWTHKVKAIITHQRIKLRCTEDVSDQKGLVTPEKVGELSVRH